MATNPNVKFQVYDNLTALMIGELDVTSSKNFPIALTYAIKDIQDITKSKGSYSKTFKLPATANNNDVLEHLFADGIYEAFKIVENKTCKIYCNGALIMAGGFKVKATTQKGLPQYYECLVFGENYEWVNSLDRLNLCDIDWDIGGAYPDHPSATQFTRDHVMDTWPYTNGEDIIGGVGTHIVYPIINFGQYINGDKCDYQDLMPTFFVKNMVVQILAGAGYTLSSNFMDSDWFKKLVTLFPIDPANWENIITSVLANSFNADFVGPSAWKVPSDYRSDTLGNPEFDGAFRWDFLTWIAPYFNGSNQWTSESFIPTAPSTVTDGHCWDAIGQYAGNDDLSLTKRTLSGWFWGQHGGQFCHLAFGSLNELMVSACGNGVEMRIIGHDFDCIWDWDTGYCVAPFGTPFIGPDASETRSEGIDSVAMFTPTELDEYTINMKFEVEMDNDYVLNNVPEPYDCKWGATAANLQIGTGFNYENWFYQYDNVYQTDEYRCVHYACSVYLAWVHDDTQSTEFIRVIDKSMMDFVGGNMNGLFSPGINPLPPTPANNLLRICDIQNLLIDVSDLNDRYYFYIEVNEEWDEYENGFFIKTRSYTQCKYRVNNGTLDGGLTNAVTTSQQADQELSALLPCETSQLDFINGLTGLFNLYWKSDEAAKIIYCEPRDDFFTGTSNAVDWSKKVAMDKNQVSKYVYDSLKRDLCFTYENDGADGFVEERNILVAQNCELDSYSMDLGSLYLQEEMRLGTNFFCPTYMFRDKVLGTNQGKSPYIPVIHKDYTGIWNITANFDFPEKIEEFGPRILSWVGKIPVNHLDGLSAVNEWRWCKDNPSSAPDLLQYVPSAMTFYDEDPLFLGPISINGVTLYPTLPYSNNQCNRVQPTPIPPAEYPFASGLYDCFWESNIENLIQRPKIKTCYFNLNNLDIANLDLRRLVYLNEHDTSAGTYWVINKVSDYKPSKTGLTKVELYEYINRFPVKKGSQKRYRSNEVTSANDYVTAQARISENNMAILGNIGINRQTTIPQKNPNALSPRLADNGNYEQMISEGKTRFSRGGLNGAVRPKFNGDRNGLDLGWDNNVIQNSKSIALGRDLALIPNGVTAIGYGNLNDNRCPIQFVVGTGNTALAIDNAGNVLEGGGGAIIFQDAAGNYQEVYTYESFGNNVRKVLKSK